MSKTPKNKQDTWQEIALWAAFILNIFYVISAFLALVSYLHPKGDEV